MAPPRVILMSCGSYNPPTNMHLRMFEIARDHLHRMGTHIVVGGVISPVHDSYAKKELASASHRCAMLRLALQNSDWIRLSTWETRQKDWTKTRLCLQHHQNLLNSLLSNTNDINRDIQIEDVEWIPEDVRNNLDNTPIQIKLLCGADLLESFGICGLWLEEDIDAIVGEHGLVVITREGCNPNKFIYDSDTLSKHMHNICIVTEWIPNEVSSTRIRRALKRSQSVRYLLQDSVISYIYKNEIYDAKRTDTTIKLELISPNANNYLHIHPKYLSAFLTPSPTDMAMESPSPVEILSIDVPDTVLHKNLHNLHNTGGRNSSFEEAREQFINAICHVDNGNAKHIAKAAAYPGQAKQIIATESGVSRIINEVGLDYESIAKFQDDISISYDSALEDNHSSKIENNTEIDVTKISDLRSETAISYVNLDQDIMKIQSCQMSSNESQLQESCWSTTENITSDKYGDREVVSEKETMKIELSPSKSYNMSIQHGQLDLRTIDRSVTEPISKLRIIDEIDSDQINFKLSQTPLEENPMSITESIAEGKVDVSDRSINFKEDLINVELHFRNDSDIVKVQPDHSSYSVITLNDDYYRTEEIIDVKTETHKKNIKEFSLQEAVKDNTKTDDKRISIKQGANDIELDEAGYLEAEAMSLSDICMASLDGRHECALSDFSVDKKDYRLSQYGFSDREDDEEKEKFAYIIKSNLMDSVGDQTYFSSSDVMDLPKFDTINDERDSFQLYNDQVLGNIMIHNSRDKESGNSMVKEIDDDVKSSEEITQETSRTIQEVDKLDRRTTLHDPTLEIDGKYLKSIVNLRKSPRKIKESQIYDIAVKQHDQIMSDQQAFQSDNLQTCSRFDVKTENIDEISERDRIFNDPDRSINDRELSQSEETSRKSSRTSSIKTKDSKRIKEDRTRHKSRKVKNYDHRSADESKKVSQNSSTKFPLKGSLKKTRKSDSELKDEHRHADNRKISRFKEFSQYPSKTSSVKNPKKVQSEENIKENDNASIDGAIKHDLIKDVYTRKVRRYNVPLKGSLDSMIVSDESAAIMQKPKNDDVFTKKSKSYESIKRIQEVFLGIPSKANSGSQLVSEQDIPDEFCSICCYMNEITFRTEEEVSSPNQEIFYTLRSNCSSVADEDSTECDICGSLNLQDSMDGFNGKVSVDPSQEEIPCELCRICGEMDGFDQDAVVMPADTFKVQVNPDQYDDNFEIENCGFQSGVEEPIDDRSRFSEQEKLQTPKKSSLPQSSFTLGSSMSREHPRDLYFIPKDEIAILTSGSKKVNRKGSLFRKKDNLSGNSQDKRRYSSIDSLQFAKLSLGINDKALKVKDSTFVGSADNLRLSVNTKRSKSLQRSTDNIGCFDSLIDNSNSLTEHLIKEKNSEAIDETEKPNIRDNEEVKMILTQHGIKVISEKETAL